MSPDGLLSLLGHSESVSGGLRTSCRPRGARNRLVWSNFDEFLRISYSSLLLGIQWETQWIFRNLLIFDVVIIYFALWLSALRASFSSYWKHYKKLSGTVFWEIFWFSRFLVPLTAEFRKMKNSWGILWIWTIYGFCVPEAPKISKIMKYNQNLFRTVFYNGSNSLKTMLYVPIIKR